MAYELEDVNEVVKVLSEYERLTAPMPPFVPDVRPNPKLPDRHPGVDSDYNRATEDYLNLRKRIPGLDFVPPDAWGNKDMRTPDQIKRDYDVLTSPTIMERGKIHPDWHRVPSLKWLLPPSRPEFRKPYEVRA